MTRFGKKKVSTEQIVECKSVAKLNALSRTSELLLNPWLSEQFFDQISL
jgi:hypothetical protein